MAVWVIAAGGLNDRTALDNYDKTLTAPISKSRLDLLPAQVALPSGELYAWGFPRTPKEGNKHKFQEMAVGDICFFCTTRCVGPKQDWVNRYHWVARVVGTVDIAYAMEVSSAFWDTDGFYPYLLGKPISIELEFEAFGAEIDPSGRFYKASPQSSSPLADRNKLKHVLEEYGTVDNWAEKYVEQLTSTPLPSAPNVGGPNLLAQHQGVSGPEQKVSYKEKLPAIREWLINVARARQLVTYGDVMQVFEIDRFSLRHAMDQLGYQSQQQSEPILTALIVGKKTRRCLDGLAVFGVADDEKERQSLYVFWSVDDFNSFAPSSPFSSLDVRAARFASVEVRPDQAVFRRKVFTAYGGCCAISGCGVERALDAAHRHGRKWRMGHNMASDGLLLRKDLHALYDSHLLTISPDGLVEISADVIEHYQVFSGATVRAMEQ